MLLLACYIYDDNPKNHAADVDIPPEPIPEALQYRLPDDSRGPDGSGRNLFYAVYCISVYLKIVHANHRVTPDLNWTDTVTFRHQIEDCPRPQHRVQHHRRIFQTRLRGSC